MQPDYNAVKTGKPHVQIGKNGLTPAVIEHINNRLKALQILKIKILPEAEETFGLENLYREIMSQLKVKIYDARGFTVIISKRKIQGIRIPKKIRDLQGSADNTFNCDNSEGDSTSDSSPNPTKEEKLEELPADYQPDWNDDDYIDYDNEELMKEIDQESDLLYESDDFIVSSEDDLNARNSPHFSQNIPSDPSPFKSRKNMRPPRSNSRPISRTTSRRSSKAPYRKTTSSSTSDHARSYSKSSRTSRKLPQGSGKKKDKLLRGPSTRPASTENKYRQKRGQGTTGKPGNRKSGRVAKGKKKS